MIFLVLIVILKAILSVSVGCIIGNYILIGLLLILEKVKIKPIYYFEALIPVFFVVSSLKRIIEEN